MIIGQLAHARVVFLGNIRKYINPSDRPHSESFHVMKNGGEIGIAYSKTDAIHMSDLLKADSFEKRKIFKQYPNAV